LTGRKRLPFQAKPSIIRTVELSSAMRQRAIAIAAAERARQGRLLLAAALLLLPAALLLLLISP
jgi:hypothetical protein